MDKQQYIATLTELKVAKLRWLKKIKYINIAYDLTITLLYGIATSRNVLALLEEWTLGNFLIVILLLIIYITLLRWSNLKRVETEYEINRMLKIIDENLEEAYDVPNL